MPELKTKRTDADVLSFLNQVEDERKRQDSFRIMELMSQVTGSEPAMWGASIIGFGQFRLKYASGRENDWPLVGFSPRKREITLYIDRDPVDDAALLARLGIYKSSKACLYIKRTDDIDLEVLRELIHRSVQRLQEQAG
jgi:hypothetical protein